MGVIFADAAEELLARHHIEELLTRRGRAADAKDPDAILAEHVPGSRDTHGIFDGTIEDFVDYLRTHNYADTRYGIQRHTVSNVIIEFDSVDAAHVESYHLAFHRIELDRGSYDVHIGGRYLDRCLKHGDRWLLASRDVVYDWSRSSPVTHSNTSEDA
jgi:3-phenylpropionate/cinnamic acid dioxygenase small subunit